MNPRGSQSLFQNIFVEDKPAEKQRKGRSETLIAQRNELLIERYYYLGRFTGNRYDLILETLSAEFFLSAVTIPKVIDEHYSKLAELKKQQPQKQYFQKKWPHLVW